MNGDPLFSRSLTRLKDIPARPHVKKTARKTHLKISRQEKQQFCPRCKKTVPDREFYKSGGHKTCRIADELSRRKADPEKFRTYRRGYMRRKARERADRRQIFLPLA